MSRLSIYLVLLGLIILSSIHTNALRNLLEEKDPHHGGHKPGHGGEEHKPGHGGEGERPGHDGGRGPPHMESAPFGSEKLVVIDGHGKHKPPHKGHPPLKGVVHLSDSQATVPPNGKCACGCNGDPAKHTACSCGCHGKSSDNSTPCSCGCGGKPGKPIA